MTSSAGESRSYVARAVLWLRSALALSVKREPALESASALANLSLSAKALDVSLIGRSPDINVAITPLRSTNITYRASNSAGRKVISALLSMLRLYRSTLTDSAAIKRRRSNNQEEYMRKYTAISPSTHRQTASLLSSTLTPFNSNRVALLSSPYLPNISSQPSFTSSTQMGQSLSASIMQDHADLLSIIKLKAREVQEALQLLAHSRSKALATTSLLEQVRKQDAERDREIQSLCNNNRLYHNFPPLDSSMLACIDQAYDNDNHTTLVEAFNIAIRLHDLGTLLPRQWLNDEIINFYGNLIAERSQQYPQYYPRLHYFNSFFYTSLRDGGYNKVRRWSRKIDLFETQLVLFPVHLGNHWCCGVIDMRHKRIFYYDSLPASQSPHLFFTLIRSYLVNEMLDKKDQSLDLTDWTNHAPTDIPLQHNGHDCGVFACAFAEFSARREPFSFSQKDMDYLRKRMVYEIVTRQLLTHT